MTPHITSSHTAISNTLPNTFFSLVPPSDPALVGIQATTALSNPPNKWIVFHYIMDEAMTLTAFTMSHVPCKVHPCFIYSFFFWTPWYSFRWSMGLCPPCLLDKPPCILFHVEEGTWDLLAASLIIDRLCHG